MKCGKSRLEKTSMMADDFYPFVDSGDIAPDNRHLTGIEEQPNHPKAAAQTGGTVVVCPAKIAIYDNMLSTPHTITIEAADVRTYLEELTNTVYQQMKMQGGSISLMVIREIVENLFHAHFSEPIISILDNGNTIRFADQGPGIKDKERAFDFGFTSATREMKRYIRGTGAGFPVIQEYLENAGGVIAIEDNMGQGTVITVTVDQKRAAEIEATSARGATVRGKVIYQEELPRTQQVPASKSSAFDTLLISERGKTVMEFLAHEQKCGPSDLVKSFGSSLATWSRELSALSETGLIIKHGQKYQLTGFGQTWTETNL